jgi:regulator of sirC expression with transglutaminase-like and TPR domain
VTISFEDIAAAQDGDINLAQAALLLAAEEYPDLDVGAYLDKLEQMALALKRRLPVGAVPANLIAALNKFLFQELGFAGEVAEYYEARNNFLNEVIDRRRGIPITLAIIYIDIGRRIGLAIEGVSFPAHFLVKCKFSEGMVVLDPFAGGISLSIDELVTRIESLHPGMQPSKAAVMEMLASARNKDILARILRNLKHAYIQQKDWTKALSASDRIIKLIPGGAEEYRDRGMIYLNLECARAALADLQAYLNLSPSAHDVEQVQKKVADLTITVGKLN